MQQPHKIMVLESLVQNQQCILTAHGRSMWPFIANGDRLHIITSNGKKIKPGMVVALFNNDQLIIHRIQKIMSDNRMVIAGDSSPGSRATVAPDEIVGIVVKNESSRLRHLAGIAYPVRLTALIAGFFLRAFASLLVPSITNQPAGKKFRNSI